MTSSEHDQGLYRHVRFRNPNNSFAWFDLITWPNNLTIAGDMGTFAFKASSEDMFAFFNQAYINTGYWMEKLKHSTSNAIEHERTYSEAAFKTWVFEDFWEDSRRLASILSHAEITHWWRELVEHVFHKDAYVSTFEEACEALKAVELPHANRWSYEETHEFSDAWNRNWWNVEWCMAAILAGVRTYNEHAASQRLLSSAEEMEVGSNA